VNHEEPDTSRRWTRDRRQRVHVEKIAPISDGNIGTPGTGTLVQTIMPSPLLTMWKPHAVGGDLSEPSVEGFVSISAVIWRKELIEELLFFYPTPSISLPVFCNHRSTESLVWRFCFIFPWPHIQSYKSTIFESSLGISSSDFWNSRVPNWSCHWIISKNLFYTDTWWRIWIKPNSKCWWILAPLPLPENGPFWKSESIIIMAFVGCDWDSSVLGAVQAHWTSYRALTAPI